jgi:pSer/pThr/pTyr-binding forkhead associated (FHA) protein
MTGIVVFILRLLLALALYAFIGLIFITMLKQYKSQMRLLTPQSNTALQLTSINQPEKTTHKINQSEVLVGRDPNCKIHIQDETVSSQHVRIYYHDNNWWIVDLNSTNGTFLNEEMISHPCVITENDEVRIGQVKFLVHIRKTEND